MTDAQLTAIIGGALGIGAVFAFLAYLTQRQIDREFRKTEIAVREAAFRLLTTRDGSE